MSYYSPSELKTKAEEIVQEAINATYREADSYREALQAKSDQEYYAAGHTGTPPPAMNAITPEETAAFEKYVEESFEWIPDCFEAYTRPQPEKFDGIIDSIKKVESTFGGTEDVVANPDLEFAGKAQAEIEEWKGHLAENFQNQFLIPFPTIAGNHGKIARMLRQAMEANQNIFQGQKRDISEIADKTLEALKACGDKNGSDAKMGLTVLSAVVGLASILLTPVTGGASVPVGMAVALSLSGIGAASSITNATIAAEQPLQLGAETVNGVIKNLLDAMSELTTKTYDQENKIVEVLEENYATITSLRQISNSAGLSGPIVPIRPDLANATQDDVTEGLAPE